MLLLTAAPGVQEWYELTQAAEENIGDGWVHTELQEAEGLRESYKTVRDCDGDYNRVTHWTRCSGGGELCSEERSERIETAMYSSALGSYIGCGYFGSVYECSWDDSKVIKIGCGAGGDGDIYEDGALAYYQYILKRQKEGHSNPLLPTVFNLYIADDESFYIALLERYESEVDVRTNSPCKLGFRWRGIKKGMNDTWGMENQTYSRMYEKYVKELKDDPEMPQMDDVCHRNCMTIGNRIVITDPAGRSGYGANRIRYGLRKLGIMEPDEDADASFLKQREEYRLEQRRQDKLRAKNISIWGGLYTRLPASKTIVFVDTAGNAEEKPLSDGTGLTIEKLELAKKYFDEAVIPEIEDLRIRRNNILNADFAQVERKVVVMWFDEAAEMKVANGP